MKNHTGLQLDPKPKDRHFIVVRRVPPLPGEPEWVVAEDGHKADAVAVFFSQLDARAYADWREKAVADQKGKA